MPLSSTGVSLEQGNATRPMIIVIGMPKSGTETISEFFQCNAWSTSHWSCPLGAGLWAANRTFPAHPFPACGNCMTRWVTDMAGRPVHDGSASLRSACGNYDVFAQVDYEPAHACMFPQVFFLTTLLSYLPHACFILNTRPTSHWLKSVRGWPGMMGRLTDACPIHPRNETGLGKWYDEHKVRASLALRSAQCASEINIEDGVGLTTHLDRFFKLNSSDACLAKYGNKGDTKDRMAGRPGRALSTAGPGVDGSEL